VTVHAGIVTHVAALIAGLGRLRASARATLLVRARIAGAGHVAADAEQKSHHHTGAVIAGVGGVQADGGVPRERVAAQGVFIPPTARGAAVPPQTGQDVSLPPTKREVVV
jgi:hypothetical protein